MDTISAYMFASFMGGVIVGLVLKPLFRDLPALFPPPFEYAKGLPRVEDLPRRGK